MTTYTQFTPTINQNFSFQPTLDKQQYNAVITWNLFGQRWVLNIYNLQNVLVLQKPLRSSPMDYDINLVQGYFATSKLIYRESTNNFEVSP
jgi:hypothetical protein